MLESIYELKITEGKIEDVLNSEKGSRVAGEVLYYLSLNWLNDNVTYAQDHLHPNNRFSQEPPIGISQEEWKKWRAVRNKLPNLRLLAGRDNSSKSDMRLIDYYHEMTAEQKANFEKTAIIPDNTSLEIEDFDKFYEARKEVLRHQILNLLEAPMEY